MKPLAGIIAAALLAVGVWHLTASQDAVATDVPTVQTAADEIKPLAAAQPAAQAPDAAANAPAAAPAPSAAAESPARIAQAQFQEGTHFKRYTPTQATQSPPDSIEVVEFFMHSCPHCFSLEPYMDRWLASKPSNVSFIRIPVSFNQMAAVHMRAYYAAEALGVAEEVHKDFFTEFHVNKNRLSDEKSLASFFEKHGVDKEQFLGTMKSFAVDSMTRKAQSVAARYKIQSVPTLVVNGKYSTDGRMAGSYERMFQIVDYLVQKESEEQSPATGG